MLQALVQEMIEELCTGKAVASTRQPHRSQQQQHQQQAVWREEDEIEETKRQRDREEERRDERGREENGRRKEEQGVRKEGMGDGSNVVEVGWVAVKCRTERRSQQERDERSVEPSAEK